MDHVGASAIGPCRGHRPAEAVELGRDDVRRRVVRLVRVRHPGVMVCPASIFQLIAEELRSLAVSSVMVVP